MLNFPKTSRSLFLFVLFSLIPQSALPADISVVPTGTPLSLIVLRGEIIEGDAERFNKAASGVGLASVLLESPGGSVVEGLSIGRTIRRLGFSTGVAPNNACASACALIWLAGSPRYMDPSALIGFHAAYREQDGQLLESGVGNALVGAYLSQIGLGDLAVIFVSSAGPTEINWLNAAQAIRVGIETVFLTSDGIERNVGSTAELKLPSGFRWIVLESSATPSGLEMDNRADQVVQTSTGYYASVIGPYEQAVAEELIRSGRGIPSDAYLSSGNGFLFSTLER